MPNKRNNAGFGMIEVVAAFLLLSLSLGVLLAGLTVGLRNSGRASGAGLALLYAQSLLAETGVTGPLRDDLSSGRTTGGFIWRREINRLPEAGRSPVAIFTVSISVTPPDNGAPVRIVTRRLSDNLSTDEDHP
ncbi:MAG: hypothetical protein EXR08_03875 [Alphaproteobacteria bacterium]|nr:hypothetical protein [Alphaproteobacteria bacterium]